MEKSENKKIIKRRGAERQTLSSAPLTEANAKAEKNDKTIDNRNINENKTNKSIFASHFTSMYGNNSANANEDNEDAYTLDELMPYLSEKEKTDLEDEAINMLNSELLRSEDLEVVVPRLLRTCTSEARELRRAMNSLASAQITEAQRALHIVKQSERQMRSLQRLFRTQGELIEGMAGESVTYAQLRQLHTLRENVNAVIEWSIALKEVRYGNLYILIECWQFAEIYKRLTRLQHIRRTVIEKAGAQYVTYQTFFEPYFVKLDAVLSHFVNEVLNMLSNDAMNIALQRALDDLPTSTDILHDEGNTVNAVNADGSDNFPEFTALKECVMVCNKEIDHPVLQYRSDGGDETPPLRLDVIESAITKGVAKMWDEHILLDIVDPVGQITLYIQQIKRIEPLLEALEFILVPLSTSFSFFGCVVRALHIQVMKVLQLLLDPSNDTEAAKLMEASEFVQWYKNMLTSTFNYATYVTLGPLDVIAASFITSAVDGLSAHLIRLSKACAINACAFQSNPTILPSGCPITTGPVDLFTVLRQSIAGISPAVELRVMCQIGIACADAIRAYIDECKQRSDFDYWEDENIGNDNSNNNNDWQQRRMLFLYAFCNDCNTIENNLDAIEMRFSNCWSDSPLINESLPSAQDLNHVATISPERQTGSTKRVRFVSKTEKTESVNSGDNTTHFTSISATNNVDPKNVIKTNTPVISPFIAVHDNILDTAFYYLDEIVLEVERVVGAQWALVFRPGPWYTAEDNPVQLIVNTELDYVDKEFSVMLQGQRSRKIARQVVVRYVVKYISALVEFAADVIRVPKKYSVDDWNLFVDCVVRDSNIFMNMWSSYISLVGHQLLQLAQRAFEVLKNLLAVKKTVDFAFIVENLMLDDFGDCPTFIIRFILTARHGELDKSIRERMLEIWHDKIAYQHRTNVNGNDHNGDRVEDNDKPTTGWTAPTSFFGSIDRTISQLDKTSRFFRKSVKKKRDEQRQKEISAEKEAKRLARQSKREKDAAATAALRSRRSNSLPHVQNTTVEVEKLSDVLKQTETHIL